MAQERGFQDETAPELFMLLLEECGEMAKAARKLQGIKTSSHSEQFSLAHEVADTFIYLLLICNKYGVNLEDAFRAKEALNKQRHWE